MLKIFFRFKCFLFVCLILLEACVHGSPPLPRQETLVAAIPQSPLLLDPRLATDAQGQNIGELLYDGLIAWDDRLRPVPHLALRWEKRGELVTRFFLREGVRFSNGEPLTSQDVLCTVRFIQDPKNTSPFRGEFEKFSVTVVDPLTFDLELKAPYAPIFTLLKKGIVHCDGRAGTGPYTLLKEKKNQAIVLKANPDYFGGGPKIKFLKFVVVKEDTVRVLKMLKGEADLVLNGIPALLLEKVASDPDLRVKESTGTTFAYLGFNLRHPLLKNRELREGIARALDREAIIEHLWAGHARPADSLLTPGHWAYAAGLPPLRHDVDKARLLLKKWEGSRITLKTSTNKERIEIAKLIAHQLEAAGLRVEVRPYEWGTFYRDIRSGNFEIYTSTWVGVTEPDIFYNILHSGQIPPAGVNRGFFQNRSADAWTLEAQRIMEPSLRASLYRKIQRLVLEELPFVPLWYENNVIVTRKDLAGVRLSPHPTYRDFIGIERR